MLKVGETRPLPGRVCVCVCVCVCVWHLTSPSLSLRVQALGSGTGDTYDLQRLVYHDLLPGDRDEVLQHIAVQAAITPPPAPYPIQVVTDYDDTIQLNWLDKRFPRKTIYPGVVEFFAALKQHRPGLPPSCDDTIAASGGDTSVSTPSAHAPEGTGLFRRKSSVDVRRSLTRTGGVVVLTARPAGVRSFVKNYTLRHLQWLDTGNLTLLTGSLWRSTSLAGIVGKKFENFRQVWYYPCARAWCPSACLLCSRTACVWQYKALFPEYKFVLIGDSGQGDAAFAARALSQYPDCVQGAFIHDVRPDVHTTGDGGLKSAYEAMGVMFFDTYVGAAQQAASGPALLAPGHVAGVATAAEESLRALVDGGGFSKGAKSAARLLAALDSLERDLRGCGAEPGTWMAEARDEASRVVEQAAAAAKAAAAAAAAAHARQ